MTIATEEPRWLSARANSMHVVYAGFGGRYHRNSTEKACVVSYPKMGDPMTVAFASPLQNRLYAQVMQGLRDTGYKGDLLRERYTFTDWFDRSNPTRQVQAAAFAQTPPSDSTACFAVVVPNGLTGPDAISHVRALGALAAFEIHSDRFDLWTVGNDRAATKRRLYGGIDELTEAFRVHRKEWSGSEMMRLKNAAIKPSARQLDFFDLKLIPALEEHVHSKLEAILKETLYEATATYVHEVGHSPNPTELFRLLFGLLSAKILHDRAIGDFTSLGPRDVAELLRQVKAYYKTDRPILDHHPTQQIIADGLFGGASFAHLSVEALSYIWEDAFVGEEDRDKLGIHGTPYGLARHIVYSLPVDQFDRDDRRFVEPCSGHGIFLVAAMQRLRELLPPEMESLERHKYFKKMLKGFEIEPFSIEVASLCLSLADFPSGNGWDIVEADVIDSTKFDEAVEQTKIVLCNPPFELIDPSARDSYARINLKSVLKPAEILYRVLDKLPADGILGFVLPQKFIDGSGYKDLRNRITRRFGEIEIASLPDRVFRKAQHESCLLICKSPSGYGERSKVSFVAVDSREWKDFRENSLRLDPRIEEKTPEEAAKNLRVPILSEVWSRLQGSKTVKGIADTNRGIRWRPLDGMRRQDTEYRERYHAKYTRPSYEPGFALGHAEITEVCSFVPPPPEYLSIKSEDQYNDVYLLDWSRPKVALNATRFSRYDWRVAAVPDSEGLIFSQRYIVVWPRPPWTPNSLAAVLNGPVVAAFLAAYDSTQDHRTTTIERVPLPNLDESEIVTLDRLVDSYQRGSRINPLWLWEGEAEQLLLQIDAAVLDGYRLPPRLERELLDYFRSRKRRVIHRFGPYFPESLKAFVPLSTYISEKYRGSTASDFLANIPKIDSPELLKVLKEPE